MYEEISVPAFQRKKNYRKTQKNKKSYGLRTFLVFAKKRAFFHFFEKVEKNDPPHTFKKWKKNHQNVFSYEFYDHPDRKKI